MLALSVLASAAVAVILGFVVYLFVGGYSGGSSPASVAPALFPVAILLFIVAGLPAMLVCGLLWAGYARSTRPRGRPGAAGRARSADPD